VSVIDRRTDGRTDGQTDGYTEFSCESIIKRSMSTCLNHTKLIAEGYGTFPAVGTFKLLIGEYLPDNEKWWMSALDPPTPWQFVLLMV
jgi:hypothetical protein